MDPARFWDLTPRLYALEVDGAIERMRVDRSMVWWGAMLPHLKKPPTHDEFVKPKHQRRVQSPDEMLLIAQCWDHAVNAARPTLPKRQESK